MFLGYQNGKIKFYTQQPLDKELYNLEKVEETELEYVLDDEEYVLKDETWEEKQVQKERERISMLYLTGADVERGIYQAKGMDFDDIVEMVETMQFAQAPQVEGIDVKALKIELKANNFYRGNPYVSAIGALLGFSDEQLNLFFETNDYTVLLNDPQEGQATGENEPIDDPSLTQEEVFNLEE